MADSPAADVAVLSLGSNLGDRHLALQRAGTLLLGTGDLSLAAASSIYETPP
ncbi:MAG: 2-amino-4-hydroxy-6-hydroxymethyldihydropteridine diphosphokinase, partial [Candidatus Marinimicrobia bacterium]|nr:2-amino-4-hydroxy-6-hydroxymethyldihydropteridine diphosphokinase [Candidatus Neomarinimicrobiota bacterium]